MYVSEFTFDHLRKAEDERFTRELEFRRRAQELSAERTPQAAKGRWELMGRLVHPGRVSARRLSHP
jgi:hypothetical protein